MNSDEKLNLITRNLQEIITEDELKKLVEEKEEISLYWGTMPTGSPHVAYFFPFIKIKQHYGNTLKAVEQSGYYQEVHSYSSSWFD